MPIVGSHGWMGWGWWIYYRGLVVASYAFTLAILDGSISREIRFPFSS
uniref:Uncharacterized protein n=1 Tax=Picea glauca TaxID=3330 RepID=A0A117NFR6_PICGL|nr:hypothetical protein ABT39_MTgene2444 [Picea glauca]